MVITLTGNEFAIQDALRTLVHRFTAKFGPHGYEQVDGETLDVANLPSLLQGGSLFAPMRLVVMRDASKNKLLWERLAGWVKQVPAETTLVVIEPTPDKRTKTYKALKAGSDFKEFGMPNDAALLRWLQAEAELHGAKLAPADAQYLLERVGRDQWQLAQEVAKLASHSTISRELIEVLVEPNAEGSAFELLDAALNGDAAKVRTHVAALRYQEDAYKLFGLLASQVHALAVVAAAGTRSSDQVAADASLHPFVVRKTQGVAKKLGMNRVQKIIEDVATCDIQLKTTGADPWQLVEAALLKLATW